LPSGRRQGYGFVGGLNSFMLAELQNDRIILKSSAFHGSGRRMAARGRVHSQRTEPLACAGRQIPAA